MILKLNQMETENRWLGFATTTSLVSTEKTHSAEEWKVGLECRESVMGEGKVEAVITTNARTIITDLKRHFQLPINRREREECVKDLRRKMIGLNI